MGALGGTTSRSVDARLREVLLETVQREVPVAGVLFPAIIALFDVLTLASGVPLTWDYLLSDVVQASAFLVVALLVGRRLTPPPSWPWLWVGAIVVSVAALGYQYSFDPGGAGVGILVMEAAMFGALTLFWTPFLASVPFVLAMSASALYRVNPD